MYANYLQVKGNNQIYYKFKLEDNQVRYIILFHSAGSLQQVGFDVIAFRSLNSNESLKY